MRWPLWVPRGNSERGNKGGGVLGEGMRGDPESVGGDGGGEGAARTGRPDLKL